MRFSFEIQMQINRIPPSRPLIVYDGHQFLLSVIEIKIQLQLVVESSSERIDSDQPFELDIAHGPGEHLVPHAHPLDTNFEQRAFHAV